MDIDTAHFFDNASLLSKSNLRLHELFEEQPSHEWAIGLRTELQRGQRVIKISFRGIPQLSHFRQYSFLFLSFVIIKSYKHICATTPPIRKAKVKLPIQIIKPSLEPLSLNIIISDVTQGTKSVSVTIATNI